jgi:hypothetical protein
MNTNITPFGELPSISKVSARMVIERLLTDPVTFSKVEPYFNNGGVCGHKVMDLKGAVDAVKAADKSKELGNFVGKDGKALCDFQIGNILKNALRSRYAMNKAWKIVGINPKLAALMAPAAAPETTPAPAAE